MARNSEMGQRVEQVADPIVRDVLRYIIDELDRIHSLPPVSEDTKQLAIIVNKITRKL